MSRSSEARRLQVQLGAETGVPVQVRWDSSSQSRGWQWHLFWSDGPTRDGMIALVDRLLPAGAALKRDKLVYLRTVRPISIALAVVRNLRLGLGPLAGRSSAWDLERHLEMQPYTERDIAGDLSLATELCRLAGDDIHQIVSLATQSGLTGLRDHLVALDEDLPANVLPFRRPEPR